jgi:GDP-L-fucose synthase
VLQGLMARLHRAKVANEPECVVWGTGQTRREFLWTDDLAEAVIWMLENYDQKEFLNVGSGQDVAIIDLARMIADVVGYVGELRTDPSKPDGMPQKLLDVSRAHSLGWRHTTDLSTGLVRLYQEFLKRYA